jgi:N-dimethylarginine dimethylaminohydrolase
MPKQVLLCPPTYFDVVDRKNPYMSGDAPVDRAKAFSQWKTLCLTLERSGYEVVTIEPVPGLEDMVFAANQAFVGHNDAVGKFVVPGRMVYPSRQREVAFFVDWYRENGFHLIDVDLGDDYLEGHGDLLWHPGGSRIYAAYGFRSTKGGIDKFAAAMSRMGISVVPVQLVDRFCYHLDTCLCPLNNEAALIYPGAYSSDTLTDLSPYWKRVHELTAEEAHKFMGNGIVAGTNYITPYLTANLKAILKREGLAPVVVDTSEFEKAGGSVFCMKTFLPDT